LLPLSVPVECLDDNDASEFVSGSLARAALTKVEGHLAGCRDCRALVAALAQDAALDSNVQTVKHEKMSASQVTELPRRTLAIGDRVGRYLVLQTLGTGGMGVVFSAYDPQLDRKIALKLLRSGLQLATKDAQKRLRREAQAIAQLSHPNVVGVYDVGTTDDGDLYIAMEFVEGDTLTQWLKAYPRSWREILDVFQQAAKGLAAAHGVGLLHRDFKPDNVLVGGDGRVRVTDFGLARSLIAIDEESARGATPQMPTALNAALTATGTVLGTPRYMPPEQLSGPDIDARADQFSFCVALYEALYGEHPLPGRTSVAMFEKGEPATPPPDTTKVPAFIGRAVMRGLQKDRAKRFPMMSQLMTELIPPVPKLTSRVAVAAGTAFLLLGAAAAAMVYINKDKPRAKAPEPEPGVTEDLVNKINELKAEIRRLNEERNRLIIQLQNPPSDVTVLRKQLQEKDEQINLLVTKIDALSAPRPPVKVVKLPPSQSLRVTNAISEAERDLDGCFEEWSERRDEQGNAHVEANLMVRLTVGPDGVAHSSVATGEPSPSLRWCVEQAIGRVIYPTGAEQLELEVGVGWSGGMMNLSPRVTGRRKVAGTTIDLH
jgi:serine/threonine protein kinase